MNRTDENMLEAAPEDAGFEQFTEPERLHEFSAEYQARREALIREAGQARGRQRASGTARSATRMTWRAAAAVAAVCIALPAGAWAITANADFLAAAFGDGWRTSQAAQEGYQDHDGEKPPTPVTYPASEVVQLDPETAEALLGDAVCGETVNVLAPDGHQLAITSAVRSENALVYRFTLHRDGGVTCLEWDEHANNVAAKGAHAPHDAQFSWSAGGDEFVYVDPNASTADTVVGYAYSVFGTPVPDGQAATLTAYTCDVPFDQEFTEDQFHTREYEIPCTKAAPSIAFAGANGGSASLSPIGMTLDTRALFAQPDDPEAYDMAQDPVNIRQIVVKMDDGSAYTVFDQAQDLDNTLSACAFDTNLSLAFNRLVDPAHVVSIEVGATDAQDIDSLPDANGDWPSDADWPVRVETYSRA